MNEFIPSKATLDKFDFINKIQTEAEKQGFKLWHCGSWAISAMLGGFFKDLNDIDIVIQKEEDKKKFCKIVEKNNFWFVEDHVWGPTEYTNGNYEIEFGSGEDPRNSYYNAVFNESNFGLINGVKLFIADPLKILESRHDMIKARLKEFDDTQKFIIDTVEKFIEQKSISL